jgi:hypothetical protein
VTQGRPIEIGTQGQDEADTGATAIYKIGEACQQHVDEVMADCIVLDQRKNFLELVGD